VPTIFRWPLLATFFAGFAVAQPVLHLKTRRIGTADNQGVSEVSGPRLSGRHHLILQFNGPPSASTVDQLKERGVAVLADVPENGLLVSVGRRTIVGDLGVRFAQTIAASDKISPLVASGDPAANGFLLVEFHPDVDSGYARSQMLNLGVELRDNPDLNPRQLMIHSSGNRKLLSQIAALDDVSYIFPASSELVNGTPVRSCAGAITTNGTTTQLIPVYGEGWDGPGLGSATLSYVFNRMTSQLPSATAQAEILRAMAEWSKVVKITWQPGTNPIGTHTVNVLFATGAHGDGYPFDGPGGVLAHTFYPSPPNPEPIAGDMHLDDAESWRIGANTDLFSVALHELGHALGLGHSDNPSAVMYPYYKMVTTLSDIDKNTAQTLYAAQDSTATAPVPPPAPAPNAPLVLTVNAPAATTTTATINLSGAASGGSGAITVAWVTSQGASGTAQGPASAWTIAGVPLLLGSNTITVTATSGTSRVLQSITITRQTATVSDTTPPALTIVSPSASTISTTAMSMLFSGTASDNVGVVAVSWSTNTGGSGNASGTTNWTAMIPLLVGANTVRIQAADAAGNTSWRTVVVTRY
jgi:hypothetical protein